MIVDSHQLDAEELPRFLDARSLLQPHETVTQITLLEGGVSGTVYRVGTSDGREFVVKRALEQLNVADDWHADPARAIHEARAIRVLHALTPQNVPELFDADEETNTITMEAAPADWLTWKQRMLAPAETAGSIDHVAIARSLATALASWQRTALHHPAVLARFADKSLFEALRVDPFHRVIRGVHPALAPAIDACIDELEQAELTLVHGDFSPKNVLVPPTPGPTPWVIDFEVVHVGHPVFDVAFLCSHLILKSIHLPQRRAEVDAARSAFLAGFEAEVDGVLRSAATASLGRHTACLLLARVDGKSPASYLTAAERETVRQLAVDVLASADPEAAFAELTAGAEHSASRAHPASAELTARKEPS
ncbi:phosphotransferase family protein [Diaminobutyricibacter sp. McL0608]|uniref:phosphotransferase family protein n=1 Tax=Leifsonia sp. McL0608 TaxID=3143537 RepID=UPI0031F2FE77